MKLKQEDEAVNSVNRSCHRDRHLNFNSLMQIHFISLVGGPVAIKTSIIQHFTEACVRNDDGWACLRGRIESRSFLKHTGRRGRPLVAGGSTAHASPPHWVLIVSTSLNQKLVSSSKIHPILR